MKTNNKFLALGIATAVIAGGIGSAAAFGGGMRGGSLENLTDEQKAQIESAAGDRDQMRAIMDSVREAHQADRDAERLAVESAIEANDYTAFQKAISEKSPMANITEEQFPLVVEMHGLQQRIEEIHAELGMEMPEEGHRRGGSGHGMMKRNLSEANSSDQ